MRMKFYFIDYTNRARKITKREAMTLITPNQLEEAKATHRYDPNISIEYMVRGGRVKIDIED